MIVQNAIKVIVIFFILNIQNFVFSETLFDSDNCNWGNNKFPCIQITKQIPTRKLQTSEAKQIGWWIYEPKTEYQKVG